MDLVVCVECRHFFDPVTDLVSDIKGQPSGRPDICVFCREANERDHWSATARTG